MSVNEKIIKALKPLGITAKPDFAKGAEEEWCAFNFVDDRGGDFGDGKPGTTIVSVMIHYYMPADKNYRITKRNIRNALAKAGFSFPEVTVLREEEVRHIVFECEIEDDFDVTDEKI